MLPVFSKLLDFEDRHGISVLLHHAASSVKQGHAGEAELVGQSATNLDRRSARRHDEIRKRGTRVSSLLTSLITTPESLQAILMGRRLREKLTVRQVCYYDEIPRLASSKQGPTGNRP